MDGANIQKQDITLACASPWDSTCKDTWCPAVALLLLLLVPKQQYTLTVVEGARGESDPITLVLESLNDLQVETADVVMLSFGCSSLRSFSRCLLLTLG
jgi:hypothetical protein